MKSRDRVITAITLDKPDRAPIKHSYLPGALLKYGEELNTIYTRYPQDFGPSTFNIPKPEDLPPSYRKGVHKDEWGTVWETTIDGIHGQVYGYPIKSLADLVEYEFPPLNISSFKGLKSKVSDLKRKGYFTQVGFYPKVGSCFFQRMQWLRGFRNIFLDLVRKPKELDNFADRLLDYCLESISLVLEAKPDAVGFADDWGTQNRLMVNPSLWKDFFKPRYRKMFKLVHDSGAYVHFHSDGHIKEIISDLAEIGVDILNPQFSCFNLEELAEATYEKMCISSDIDRQYVLPKGKPSEVKAYVKRVIELFSHECRGGLICHGEINIDVPLTNVEAMYLAFKKYGKFR